MAQRKFSFWTIFELLPILATIVGAAAVILMYRMGWLDANALIASLVALVGLQALSEVVSRYRILARIDKNVEEAASFSRSVANGHLATYFLKDRNEFPDFKTRIKDAREIWILGLSLEQIITAQLEVFLAKARAGCKFRFLLMDPNSTAVQAKSYGLFRDNMSQSLKDDINNACRKIESIRSSVATAGGVANIELKYTNYVPSYGMLLIDPATDRGDIVVELYPFLVTADARPHFDLKPIDGKWFAHFKGQFDDIWNSAAANSEIRQ